MKTTTENSQCWRALLMIPIAVMAVLSIVATGGSSGGGDDGFDGDVPEEPPIILSTYNFEIGSTDSTIDVPLTVSVGTLGELAVNFGNTILGRIDLDVSTTGDVTLLSTVTDAGSTFSLTANISEPALSAGAAVTVTQDINADAFDVPTSGAFEITTTPPIGTITVTILPTMAVEISLDGGTPSTYGFEEFTELIADPSAQEYEVVASVAVLAYEFLFERVFEVVDVLDELEEVDLTGQIAEQCDSYRVAPPASVESVPGQVTLTSAGPVVYTAEWTDCWADTPFDTLLNGVIQLANYIEEVDASNRLTRIGFGPDADTRGGVEFVDFRIEEAVEVDGVFVIDPSSSVEVNGGFSLVFTAL